MVVVMGEKTAVVSAGVHEVKYVSKSLWAVFADIGTCPNWSSSTTDSVASIPPVLRLPSLLLSSPCPSILSLQLCWLSHCWIETAERGVWICRARSGRAAFALVVSSERLSRLRRCRGLTGS